MGYSHVKRDWVTWANHRSKSLLQNEKVVVVGNDKEFESFWGDLLKVTGASPAKIKGEFSLLQPLSIEYNLFAWKCMKLWRSG